MAIVRVRQSVVVVPRVEPGQTPWPVALREDEPRDSDDPVVLEFPWAFIADDVEEATANPGARRMTRRPA